MDSLKDLELDKAPNAGSSMWRPSPVNGVTNTVYVPRNSVKYPPPFF